MEAQRAKKLAEAHILKQRAETVPVREQAWAPPPHTTTNMATKGTNCAKPLWTRVHCAQLIGKPVLGGEAASSAFSRNRQSS